MNLPYTAIPISAMLPEIILVVAGCLALFFSKPRSPIGTGPAPVITLVGIIAAFIAGWLARDSAAGCGLVYDNLTYFARLATLSFGFAATLVAWHQSQADERGEFFSMILFTLVGVLLVSAANDLVILFVALELVSIPTYIMIALSRSKLQAAEASTKYFFLGALSAAIMAYGFSFVYGVAGTTSLSDATLAMVNALDNPHTMPFNIAIVGLILSFAGLLFKIAAVPMHFYVADVYQGASSPVAGLLGFVPKFAGILAIFKIVSLAGWQNVTDGAVFWMIWVVAVASMTLGNLLALMQTNLKRMLAYSGIAHAGYMLVAVIAGPLTGSDELSDGTAAILYYVVVYGIANLAAFAVLSVLRTSTDKPVETLREIAGLLRSHPGLALIMALAMFTLMGLPPTAGFWGKLSLFSSALAIENGNTTWILVLVIIAVVNSALAAAYYLRVAAACLLYENPNPAGATQRDAQQIGVLLCALLLLALMFRPNDVLARGKEASESIATPVATVQPTADEQELAQAD